MLDGPPATSRESGDVIWVKKGLYSVRQTRSAEDMETAQALRARCFGLPSVRDSDSFDGRCLHFLMHRISDGALVCCFRLLPVTAGDVANSYSAQYYELSGLEAYAGKMVELGRFCVDPAVKDPDVLRVAWGAIAAYVDAQDVQLLFGCSSFSGTDARDYLDAFAILKARHLAPKCWRPRIKAPDVFRYAARLRRKPDARKAMQHMPPLLRTYLTMGGWVSDHAVVDRQMNTLHVFTAVEVAAIPKGRKRLLRALAG